MNQSDESLFVHIIGGLLIVLATAGLYLYCGKQTIKQNKEVNQEFIITAYCPGSCCNGQWAHQTKTGFSMKPFIKQPFLGLAAVDPKIIPLYSFIKYDGKIYWCLDVGGKIKGRRVDVLLPTHRETVNFGVKRGTVLVMRNL